MRGIYIARTSSAASANVHWATVPLFKPGNTFYFNFGDELIAEPPAWRLARPELPQTLVKIADRDALPKLRAIHSIVDFKAFTLGPDMKRRPQGVIELRNVYVEAALGNFNGALENLATLRQHEKFFRSITITPEHYDELLERFEPRLEARDRAGVAELLHQWEAYTVRQLKLEHLWQPSPFPVEL
ncbi:MAG: hypothetical protein K2P80_11335 [Beijerinckiaceae bacterium]|nr:hypothetical protein [Beijerinckiaceae bacterium]